MLEIRATATATNVSGTSSASVTVTKPVDTADGDTMLFFTNGPIGTVTPPAGLTLLGTVVDGTATQSNLYKKTAASEGASYAFTFPSSSAVGVAAVSFVGAHDVLLWGGVARGTDKTPTSNATDAARDSAAFMLCAWSDTATNTVTADQGTEQFDVAAANTGSTLFRGMAGYNFGGTSDIVNAGDFMPGTTFTVSTAPTGSVNWQLLIGDKEPDTEPWSSTNGSFAVDLKLDEVAVNDTGSIDTVFRGDITGSVSAFTESAEVGGFESDKLADGLTSTAWFSGTVGGWVQYDFGSGVTKVVKRYRLTSSTFADTGDPQDWTLKGSNNGTDFTVLDTRTNEAFAFRSEVREFATTNTTAYRYYRLDITTNRSPTAATSTGLAEFRVSSHSVWEDVTTFVNEESKIRITRGLQGSSGRSDFTRAYVEFNNTDGRFSTRYQDGAFYGSLQRNTQMRISKAYGTKSLQLQGDVNIEGTDMVGDGVRTVLTNTLSVTGDIDIRIDLEPESWRDEQVLCGIAYPDSGDEGWAVRIDEFGIVHLAWHDGAASFNDVSSELAVPQGTRQAVRVTMDVNDGAGGKVITFYTGPSIAADDWTVLGVPIELTGTTSIGYSGGALCVGHVPGLAQRGIHGLVYGFQLRTGIGGTLVSEIDFTALTNGAHTFTENSNNWITVNNAAISNRRYRFHGEVAEWPKYWDSTGSWIVTSATGAGVQKRLERNNAALSAMRRYHTKGVIEDPGAFERLAEPAAYWPVEDKEGAFQISSGLPGKPTMQVYGTPDFEGTAGGEFHESDTLPKLNGAKYGGRVVGNPRNDADIRWIHYSPTGMADNALVMEGYASGMISRFTLTYETNDTWRFDGFREGDDGAVWFTSGSQSITTEGEKMHLQLLFADNAGDVTITFRAFDTYGTSLGSWTDTFAATELGRLFRVNINPDGDISDSYVGHIAVYGADSPAFNGTQIGAHHYETAGNRLKRLCAEEQVEFRHIGSLDDSAYLGYQGIDTPFSEMSTAAVSDGGFLIDPLDAFGIEYRTLRSLYNQAAHLTLSYTGNELSGELRPIEDDSYIANDFTAQRGGAGSARFQRTDGRLSVHNPPDGVGPYERSQSYSLAHEGQCVDIASWEVHKGTLDEERYTRVEVALENLRIAADSALVERILLLDVGDRIDITDTPDFMPAEDIRQIVIGYEEWFDNFQHDFRLNTLPERVYEVAEYDAGRNFDSHGSVLYQDVNASTTSLVPQVETGQRWTSDVKATPFKVRIDGEILNVVAPGDLINTNPFFDTTVSDWTAQNCAIAHSTTYVHPHPDAVASLRITPDGTLGNANALAPEPDVAVSPQNLYSASGWVFAPDGYDSCRIIVSWFDSGGVFLSNATVTADSVPAGEWTFIREEVTAPASAAFAQIICGQTNSPTASEITYWWAVRFTEVVTASDSSWSGDSFNRADSTTSLGSTDGVGTVVAWTQNLGTWGISSNQAYISAAGNSIATIPAAADLEWVEVTIPTWASGDSWINVRFTDTSNRVRFGGTVGAGAQLQVVTGGATVATHTADNADGNDFLLAAGDVLAMRVNGTVFECFVNGIMCLCITDNDQTGTRVGLQTAVTTTRFNDFYAEFLSTTQDMKVVRGVNGAAASHKAGAAIELVSQPYRGI